MEPPGYPGSGWEGWGLQGIQARGWEGFRSAADSRIGQTPYSPVYRSHPGKRPRAPFSGIKVPMKQCQSHFHVCVTPLVWVCNSGAERCIPCTSRFVSLFFLIFQRGGGSSTPAGSAGGSHSCAKRLETPCETCVSSSSCSRSAHPSFKRLVACPRLCMARASTAEFEYVQRIRKSLQTGE